MGQYFYLKDENKNVNINMTLSKKNKWDSNYIMLKLGEEDVWCSKYKGKYYFANKLLGLYQYIKENPSAKISYIGDYDQDFEKNNGWENIKVYQKTAKEFKDALFINHDRKEYIYVKEYINFFRKNLKDLPKEDIKEYEKSIFFPLFVMLLTPDGVSEALSNFDRFRLEESRYGDYNKEEIEYYIKKIAGLWSKNRMEVKQYSPSLIKELENKGYKNITGIIHPLGFKEKVILKKEQNQEQNNTTNENVNYEQQYGIEQ